MVRECELKTPIEAIQYDGRNWDEIDEFLGENYSAHTPGFDSRSPFSPPSIDAINSNSQPISPANPLSMRPAGMHR